MNTNTHTIYQALFAPLPRHLYGELARTNEGAELLVRENTLQSLLTTARADGPLDELKQRKAALWALGHIGSSEAGYAAVCAQDSEFVEWCISGATTSARFGMRGTFFHILGLLSRTSQGSALLALLGWDSAQAGGNSAVALPRDPSVLFQQERPLDDSYDRSLISSTSALPPDLLKLTPYLHATSQAQEVLNLVSKLPTGIIMIMKQSFNRLDQILAKTPTVFDDRELYLMVLKLFESFSFPLHLRRRVQTYFSIAAKSRRVL
jgi:rapamycin-insensitive companion of mTOR